MESTKDVSVMMVPGGFHCTDLFVTNGEMNRAIMDAIQPDVDQMVTWIEEYYTNVE